MEQQQQLPPSRFKLWSIHLTFNTIVLIAILSRDVENNVDENNDSKQNESWAIALSILSFILSLIFTIVNILPKYRTILIENNPKVEGIIIVILTIFWITLVAIVSSPTSGLAVYDDGAVYLANLYYFTWSAFIMCVILGSFYVEDRFQVQIHSHLRGSQNQNQNVVNYSNSNDSNDDGSGPSSPSSTQPPQGLVKANTKIDSFIFWTACMVSSLIVMGTSADIYNRNCEVAVEFKPQPFCGRSVFAITTGTIGVVFSLVMIIMKISIGITPFLMELGLAGILFILYCLEIVFVTAQQGPGAPLGNLYYFSWISFFCIFGVGKCCYEDYVSIVETSELEFQQQREMRGQRHNDVNGHLYGSAPGGNGPLPSLEQMSSSDDEEIQLPGIIVSSTSTSL